jgi:peptide/nickel transport system permease protein
MGVIARTTRAAVAETRSQEFVQALVAKGLPRRAILLHLARNAAPTVLAVIGLQFVVLLGGSILIETVFSWPGSGLLLNNAIFQRDMPVLQGTVLVLALLFISTNLVIDIVQTFVDPRIRRH